MKQIPVRYGRNYKVVLAIVLPCLLIAPFIGALQLLKALDEWAIWLIIFAFLGCIIGLSLWLVMRVYPKAMLNINGNEINLRFDPGNFLSPTDFSFEIKDIHSVTMKSLGDALYFVFVLKDPKRKFQVSASSYSLENQQDLQEAISEINNLTNQANT